MHRAQRNALPVPLALVMMMAAAVGAVGGAIAQPSTRQFSAVVCTSDASGRWTVKGRGTLNRTRSESELAYSFESDAHSFEWRFVTSREGHTTILGPGFLMHKFGGVPRQREDPLP